LQGYDVVIRRGGIDHLGELVSRLLGGRKTVVVSDSKVATLYSDRILNSLRSSGVCAELFVFDGGEENKSFATLEKILDFAVEAGLKRDDFFMALGGGICGDITGFAASVYMRGIPFVQVPTTLLAMVDSSIGGKTAVNLKGGKNLAGAFHKPTLVLDDPDVLSTLDEATWNDGMAEVIKHGVLAGGRLWGIIQSGREKDCIEELIDLNVKIKKSYIEQDEADRGARQFLNFGHTIGHAIEKCSGFNISHGHAVAMGIVAETRSFIKSNGGSPLVLGDIVNVFEKNDIDIKIDYSANELFSSACHDKKVTGREIKVVAPLGIGNCVLKTISLENLMDYIAKGL